MPFTLTDIILDKYYLDEFEGVLVYGPLGFGKSSYCSQAVAEAYGIHSGVVAGYNKNKEPYYSDWEATKLRLKFHPKEVMTFLLEREERDITFIWDDAGLWLYALDWTHPFVKAFGRYLNVARTDFGSILFTTPNPMMVMKKVRDMPQVRTVKIIKQDVDNLKTHYKLRMAKIYQMWMTPDLKKSGVKETHRDIFHAYLPDDFYRWYKPKRDYYAKMAKMMMSKELAGLLEDVLGKGADQEMEWADKEMAQADEKAEELMETIPI
jgi:hypothetical protein